MKQRARARLGLVSGLLIGALVLSACGGKSTGGTQSPTAPQKTVEIAFFAPLANSYVKATIEGMQEVANKKNAKITLFDTEFDPTKQFNQVQDATTQKKFDAFIVIPLDGVGLVPAAETAIKAGIKVVNTDLILGPDQTTTEPQVAGQAGSVLTTPIQRAKNSVSLLVAACEGIDPCKVGWIAGVATIDFEKAIKDEITEAQQDHPNIKLVAYQDGGNYLSEPAVGIAQNMLQAHRDLDVLATSGDQMTLGAEIAVNDANLAGKLRLIGGGASCPGIKAVEAGTWFGTTLDVPRNEGVIGAEIAIAAVRGEQTAPRGVDAHKESGFPEVLTKGTLGGFKCQWEG